MARLATCPYCKATRPSSRDLPFFESRESGTSLSKLCAKCGLYEIAHRYWAVRRYPEPLPQTRDHEYAPHGEWDTDSFYCGCRGWD